MLVGGDTRICTRFREEIADLGAGWGVVLGSATLNREGARCREWRSRGARRWNREGAWCEVEVHEDGGKDETSSFSKDGGNEDDHKLLIILLCSCSDFSEYGGLILWKTRT